MYYIYIYIYYLSKMSIILCNPHSNGLAVSDLRKDGVVIACVCVYRHVQWQFLGFRTALRKREMVKVFSREYVWA